MSKFTNIDIRVKSRGLVIGPDVTSVCLLFFKLLIIICIVYFENTLHLFLLFKEQLNLRVYIFISLDTITFEGLSVNGPDVSAVSIF